VDEEIGRGGHFGLDLLVRAPDWLGPAATRAATVPGAEQCATDAQLAAVEAALRASELDRKRRLDAAKAAKNGRAGGSVPSSPNAASRS
jgi:hypothetical protein